ncbi:unnamed protein product, partial [Brassica rapa]
ERSRCLRINHSLVLFPENRHEERHRVRARRPERRSPSRNPLWSLRRDRNHQNPNRIDH